MACLTNWLCNKCRVWSVSTSWFPLLFLALLWLLATWCHFNLFPDIIPPVFWPYFALGSTAYLLILAYFLLFHDHDRPVDVSTRTATALVIGTAIVFGFYAWSEWPKRTDLTADAASNPSSTAKLFNTSQTTSSCISAVPTPLNTAKHSSVPNQTTSSCVSTVSAPPNEAKSDNGDPLNLVNVFAAILGVVLAAVALIAQKSAADAKIEAEQARKDILEALDIRILALSNHLLEHAQTAKFKEGELLQSVEEFTIVEDQNTVAFFQLGCDCLVRLSRFFSYLHRWILEPRIIPADDLVDKADIFLQKLGALDEASKTATHFVCEHAMKQLRTEFWQPAIRLIEKLLTLGLPRSATPSDAEKLILKLREVHAMLNQL